MACNCLGHSDRLFFNTRADTFPNFHIKEGKVQVTNDRLNNFVRLLLITLAGSFRRRVLILSKPISVLVLSYFSWPGTSSLITVKASAWRGNIKFTWKLKKNNVLYLCDCIACTKLDYIAPIVLQKYYLPIHYHE